MRLRIIILAVVLIMAYFLGQSHCQNTVATKQIEVIKYVEKKKAQIMAAPVADKSELLNLMHNGQL